MIYSKETGPGPYLVFGLVMGAVMSLGRFGDAPTLWQDFLRAVPSLIVGPAVGLLCWLVIRWRQNRASRKLAAPRE
jgi:hypothetical protein